MARRDATARIIGGRNMAGTRSVWSFVFAAVCLAAACGGSSERLGQSAPPDRQHDGGDASPVPGVCDQIPQCQFRCPAGTKSPVDGAGCTHTCECVPIECSTQDCGPAPGTPNWQCPDGTTAGPSCSAGADGVCAWHIIDCPPDGNSCANKACGTGCRSGTRVNAEACTRDGQCEEANLAACTCTSCKQCTVNGCADLRCPEAEPLESSGSCFGMGPTPCIPTGSSCQYGAIRCACTPNAQNCSFWHCEAEGGEPGCPAREPVTGRSCYASRLTGTSTCRYGSTMCTCTGGPPDEAAAWSCVGS